LAVTLTGAGNPGVASLAAPPSVATGTVLTYHLYETVGAAVVSANPYAIENGAGTKTTLYLDAIGWPN
jgi:hypothetical protein